MIAKSEREQIIALINREVVPAIRTYSCRTLCSQSN